MMGVAGSLVYPAFPVSSWSGRVQWVKRVADLGPRLCCATIEAMRAGGQCAGRWTIGRRCGRARRAEMLTTFRRRVARELPQQRTDCRGCIHTVKQYIQTPATDHVDVIDTVRACAHPGHHGGAHQQGMMNAGSCVSSNHFPYAPPPAAFTAAHTSVSVRPANSNTV